MFTKREIFALMFTKREIVFVKREILVYSCKKYIRHKETHKMAIHDKNGDSILKNNFFFDSADRFSLTFYLQIVQMFQSRN